MIDERKLEEARGMLAIANDGERSVIERVIAFDYACTGAIRVADGPGELEEIVGAIGVPIEVFGAWGIAHSLELLSSGVGKMTDEHCLDIKARAMAAALFPEVAKGMVDHE